MEERIVLGSRILGIRCLDDCDPVIRKAFFDLLRKHRDELIDLMDENKVPKEVLINLKAGESDLAGIYYKHKEKVAKNVIVLDIFTNSLSESNLEMDLLDVFVHELIHHMVSSERETIEKTRSFMKEVSSTKI